MKKERLEKKLVVFSQLMNVIINIINETDEDFLIFKNEDPKGTPIGFIKEIIEIGHKQSGQIQKKIRQIENYYECTKDEAILLLRFTDAYFLCMKNNSKND